MDKRRSQRLLLSVLLGLSLQTNGCALLIAGAAGGAAAGTTASVKESREEQHAPMTYAGTVLANVVYFPAKVVFAGGGAVVSGVSYVATLGHIEPTASIWNASVKGDYVMTPSMIEGKTPIHFVGTTATEERQVARSTPMA